MAEKITVQTEPHGYTIFCDDIRQEMNGKQSLMGVYNNLMILAGPFPHLLPKLCFSTHYREPRHASRVPIEVKVFLETAEAEETLFSGELEFPGPPEGPAPIELLIKPSDRGHFREIVASGAFQNLLLSAPCRLKVRAYRGDDEEVRIGVLNISNVPDEATLSNLVNEQGPQPPKIQK